MHIKILCCESLTVIFKNDESCSNLSNFESHTIAFDSFSVSGEETVFNMLSHKQNRLVHLINATVEP